MNPSLVGLPGTTEMLGMAGVPRKTNSRWEILAPAKLNLYLEVLGPRPDGFHDLETLMVPVRIYDQLSWQDQLSRQESALPNQGVSSTGDTLMLRVRNLLPDYNLLDDSSGSPPSANLLSSDNLILRAAHLLAEAAGVVPHGRFDLIKRIPVQAGMGGGSSDAAATLLLANAAWKINYTREQLLPLAAKLGSDVPFFLGTGAAICRGRGEVIEPVDRLPRLHFIAVKPPMGLSTAEVFGQLSTATQSPNAQAPNTRAPNTRAPNARATASQDQLTKLIAALQNGELATAAPLMTNRLEAAAQQIAPWLVSLRETFSQAGCLGHFMTGSGSTYVGVMRSATQARRTALQLSGMNLGNVFATSTC